MKLRPTKGLHLHNSLHIFFHYSNLVHESYRLLQPYLNLFGIQTSSVNTIALPSNFIKLTAQSVSQKNSLRLLYI